MSRILVVDDDPLVRTTIRRMLAGHEVVEAENGLVALEAFAAGPFALVITDLMMPDHPGLPLIAALRARTAAVRIVAMSGGSRDGAGDPLAAARRAGADAVLAKPFRRTELLALVATLLGA
jgi:two-component system chemotaxis response regulator CheY